MFFTDTVKDLQHLFSHWLNNKDVIFIDIDSTNKIDCSFSNILYYSTPPLLISYYNPLMFYNYTLYLIYDEYFNYYYY